MCILLIRDGIPAAPPIITVHGGAESLPMEVSAEDQEDEPKNGSAIHFSIPELHISPPLTALPLFSNILATEQQHTLLTTPLSSMG